MNIADFITELYCKIDDALPDVPRHPQAILSISELVTIGVLHAMKNVKTAPLLPLAQRQLWPSLPQTAPPHPGCSAVWQPKPAGSAASWPNPPSWAWPTATESSCAIPLREGRRGASNREEGRLQPSLDRGRQALHRTEPVGFDYRLGLRHCQRPRTRPSCRCSLITTVK